MPSAASSATPAPRSRTASAAPSPSEDISMAAAQGLRSRIRFGSLKTETRLTILLFLVSFFISGMPRVYTQTAAHTLFLDLYGSAALPYAYFAEALFVP